VLPPAEAGTSVDSTVSDVETALTLPALATVTLPTIPAIQVPVTTVPEITVPATTVPEITVPAITVPATTLPKITVPG
jgi:hypothetical protein